MEDPKKVARFVNSAKTAIHNFKAIIMEMEKIGEELNDVGEANRIIKQQLKKSLDENNELRENLEASSKQRKEDVVKYGGRVDDQSNIIRQDKIKIQQLNKKLQQMALNAQKAVDTVRTLKATIKIEDDEINTKNKELGQEQTKVIQQKEIMSERIKMLEGTVKELRTENIELKSSIETLQNENRQLTMKLAETKENLSKMQTDETMKKLMKGGEYNKPNIKY